MKQKTIVTSLVIMGILVISVVIGYVVQVIWDSVDRARFPRPEKECVLEDGSTTTIRNLVELYSEEYGVPEYIVYSVIRVESGFDESAVSSKGAIGLMQLTPSTFEWLLTKTKETLSKEALYSPNVNIKYGTYYLRYLYVQFSDWDMALAAYNAGPGRVSSWLADDSLTDEDGKLQIIPFEETKNYVKKVNDTIEVYKRLYYS